VAEVGSGRKAVGGRQWAVDRAQQTEEDCLGRTIKLSIRVNLRSSAAILGQNYVVSWDLKDRPWQRHCFRAEDSL